MRAPYVDPNFWNPRLPLKYARAMRFGTKNWEVKYGEPVTDEHRAFIGGRLPTWFRARAVVYDLDAVQQRGTPVPVRKSKYADVSAARAVATE